VQSEDYLHLFVSLANAQLDPFTGNCSYVVSGNNGKGKEIACEGTESDDEDYQMSDEGSVEIGLNDMDGLGLLREDMVVDELSEFDLDSFLLDLDGLRSDEERPYLDKGYKGKIYSKNKEEKIVLEKGMLFESVDAFREVLRDFVIQEGFEVIRTRNERNRVSAMCAAHGCEWYLHASTNTDDTSFEIKTYDGVHTCTKKITNSEVNSTWIANKMIDQFRVDPKLSNAFIAQYLLEHYNVTVGNMCLYRRPKKSLREITVKAIARLESMPR